MTEAPQLSPATIDMLNRLFTLLRPPRAQSLSEWAENHIILPPGQSARPGKFRNWPYLKEVLDSIGDRACERVTLIKPVRVGFTKCLIAAVAGSAARDPCPVLMVLPTGEDATRVMVDEIDPVFQASRDIRKLMLPKRDDGRYTLHRRAFIGGGDLKIIPAKAPRSLRSHDAKYVYIDEADAMEVTSDGDPVTLAENRAFAHEDRKIVVGSTPTTEGISVVDQRYQESDQRVFEVPCPQCGVRFEIVFANIRWPQGEPEKAHCVCPNGCVIEETSKVEMVYAGSWRATRPEIEGHRGYRLNAFVSLLANAAWGKLATEWLRAKKAGIAQMQVFVNQIEGRVWKSTTGSLTAEGLAGRVEAFSLTDIPLWVLALTAGIDVQDDRLEITILGWPMPPRTASLAADRRAAIGSPAVLGHHVIAGSTLDKETWAELDDFLRQKWMHPRGWAMTLDGVAIDSGGHEGRTQAVYEFCKPRLHRRIFAIKGMPGARQVWQRGVKTKGRYLHWNVAVDVLKTMVQEALAQPLFAADATQEERERGEKINPHAMRLSWELTPEWFEQVTNERRKLTYVQNRPVLRFEPIARGKQVEALDCLVYGYAVRHAPEVMNLAWNDRAARRGGPDAKPRGVGDWSAAFNA